jgi:hypothetical protein
MYVMTEIHELETVPESCVDRLARMPGHRTGECMTGTVVQRDGEEAVWRCSGSRRPMLYRQVQGGGLRLHEDWLELQEAGGSVLQVGESVLLAGETVVLAGGESGLEAGGSGLEETGPGQEAPSIQLPKNYQLTGALLWEETSLMSPFAARPLVIVQQKEGRDTLQPLFRTYLDPQIHEITHYMSDPSWGDSDFCLWSPRGGKVVEKIDCTEIKVDQKTVVRNPIKVKAEAPEEEDISKKKKRPEEEDISKKRKRTENETIGRMSNEEVESRVKAYKWMVERNKLKEIEVEEKGRQKLDAACVTFHSLLRDIV